MHPARKIIKYTLWLLLALIAGLMLAGLVSYRLDVMGYIDYLNTRDVRDVSFRQPMSIVRLFIPAKKEKLVTIEELLWELDASDTGGGVGLDQDFMDFFGDFSTQDRAAMIITGEDFGFVAEPQEGEDLSGSEQRTMTEEEQQALLLERLRQREARLEQEAMMQAQ